MYTKGTEYKYFDAAIFNLFWHFKEKKTMKIVRGNYF